jgi:hypothetical protein
MPYAKHESFHIREGWLPKGLTAVQHDPRALRREEAPIRLGLGRNMIRALRFWLLATGLTEQDWEGHLVQVLTPFGSLVSKYDYYLEDEGTLWLIHYHLACSEDGATAWYWFFNHFAYASFEKELFIEELGQWALNQEDREPIARRTLERDFRVLVRTYLPSKRKRSPEDRMESPLTELGLLAATDDERYRKVHPATAHLHPLVVLYVLLQQAPGKARMEHNIGLTQALREPMSVGRVFNLGTAGLMEILNRLSVQYPSYRVSLARTAGLDRLNLPSVEPLVVLENYYEERIKGKTRQSG